MENRNKAIRKANRNTIDLYPCVNISSRHNQSQFSIPLLGGTLSTPAYRASLPGKSNGYVPCDAPTANPLALYNFIPS